MEEESESVGEPVNVPDDTVREPAIDIVRLAQKVYELMRAELRLERARGAATVRQR